MEMASEPATGLADALRAHTHALHAEAERTGYVRRVLRGEAERAGYALLIANLLPAYRALEAGLERHRAASGVRCIAEPTVYRTPALESDLAALAGRDWRRSLAHLPEGERYAARIAQLAADDGVGLIAHAYVRYLGDLNGGQVLSRVLARSPGLTADELAFYDFPDIADREAFKIRYRRAFDRAGREVGAHAALLNETAFAFRLNIDLSLAVAHAVSGHEPLTPGRPRPAPGS